MMNNKHGAACLYYAGLLLKVQSFMEGGVGTKKGPVLFHNNMGEVRGVLFCASEVTTRKQ